MTEGTEDPFVILGIAPTDSLAKIKLAYFAALKLHPPQSDPEGFRRLRTAYDRLMKPAGLAATLLTGTFDAKREYQRLQQEIGPSLVATVKAQDGARRASMLRAQFEEHFSANTWAAAIHTPEVPSAEDKAKG